MGFKEFANVEGRDYDIANVEGRDYDLYSNDGNMAVGNDEPNPYVEQLIDLIGILEDEEYDHIDQYGITVEEYYNPTEETIRKVKETLGIGKGL